MNTYDNINKVLVVAHVPKHLEEAFLKHLRSFDLTHPGCHFEVAINDSTHNIAETIDRFRKVANKLGLPVFGVVRDHRRQT